LNEVKRFSGDYAFVKKINGFTFMELLVVVIVVGILVSAAIPILNKNIEKSRTSEAATTLNLIRMAERDYFLDNKTYTTNFDSLNIDNPNNTASANRYFDYTITSADANGFSASATRKDGPYTGDNYTIDQTGSIDSSNGHFQL
jgi:prepilin-type N-terminal cleavage/methylation domain-containing protein